MQGKVSGKLSLNENLFMKVKKALALAFSLEDINLSK